MMNKQLTLKLFLTIGILFLFVLIPTHVVWGGQNFQTVPTIGPTNTPTRTKTFTANQPISTQTSVRLSTSTPVSISPVAATATTTAEATQASLSETSEPEKTTTISATVDPTQSESTSVVVLPVVSNGDSTPGEQSSQEGNKPIPAFVFPLVVVLLFVIIYLSTRLSLKKSQDEIQPK